MEQIKKFLRGKGFALAMVLCLLAAAAAGVWTVRALRSELEQDAQSLRQSTETASSRQLSDTQEADQWQQDTTQAANSIANVPKATAKPSSPSASSAARSASSGAASGSGTVLEPQELHTGSESASSSAAQASTLPVLGRMLNAYSGDELVYSKTLGDWRTHNGVDYACEEGETVVSPVAGTVVKAGAEDNWGEAVTIKDGEGRIWRLCGVAGQKVKQGDTVTAGQTIGTAGTIGAECAEDSHIHVEVTSGGKYLDPAKLLS